MRPTSSPNGQRPIIVCPLEFERSALRESGLDSIGELQCCGPGGLAMTRWAQAMGATSRPVILAGLAGALHLGMNIGAAHVIGTIINEQGVRLAFRNSTRMEPKTNEQAACSITSNAETVKTAAEKAALHRRRAADLVDLESLAFAQHADRLGWRWAIVRGVSDAADASLPENIDQWVTDEGKPRGMTIAKSILLRPSLIAALPKLRRDSRAAMRAVAERLRELLGESSAG